MKFDFQFLKRMLIENKVQKEERGIQVIQKLYYEKRIVKGYMFK